MVMWTGGVSVGFWVGGLVGFRGLVWGCFPAGDSFWTVCCGGVDRFTVWFWWCFWWFSVG